MRAGVLFLEIVVEVEVGSLDADVVLTGNTEDALNRWGSLDRGTNWSGDRASRGSGNCNSRLANRWLRRGGGGECGGDSLLDERGQLRDDLGDQVRISRWAHRGDLLLDGGNDSDGPGGGSKGSGAWTGRRLADGNKVFLNISGFKISVRSGSVAHRDEGSKRIDVATKEILYIAKSCLRYLDTK